MASLHGHFHLLALLFKLPGNDHAAWETEADAIVRLEVPRCRWPRVPRQVVRRGDDPGADLLADAQRDHVSLDALAGAHSRIEATGNDVGQCRVDGDLQIDRRVLREKARKQ